MILIRLCWRPGHLERSAASSYQICHIWIFVCIHYMHSTYLVSLKRLCGNLKVGHVWSGTPGTSETGILWSPELSQYHHDDGPLIMGLIPTPPSYLPVSLKVFNRLHALRSSNVLASLSVTGLLVLETISVATKSSVPALIFSNTRY